MSADVEKQLEILSRGVAEIFPLEELKSKIERSISTGKPLRAKLGVDPSTKDLHLGHTVVLRKLRQFQELGHKAVLIIGDGTGLVGDPSGRDSTRPQLTPEEIDENARTYIEQAAKVLDTADPEKFEMRRNGDWFREMDFFNVVGLASRMTVARLLERDDFDKRFKKQTPIYLHELLYPIMQGWDSVVVKADVELGGTDQKYNLLVGRDFQRAEGQEPQVCMTMPLLVGTDGKKKMSKTYGNHIGVTEPAQTMFDKIVSIPDELMEHYFTLLSGLSIKNIEEIIEENEPLHAKRYFLAPDVLSTYYPPEVVNIVRSRHYGAKILRSPIGNRIAQKVVISNSDLKNGKIWIVKLVRKAKFANSNSEARKLISAGAVSLDDEKLTEPDADIEVKEGQLLRVGKKRLAVVSFRQEEQ